MVMLVSLEQASEHLKRDTTADDNDLTLKIEAASALILAFLADAVDFLDTNEDVVTDTDGAPQNIPRMVQQATLLQIGSFYSDREDGSVLSPAVKSLLRMSGASPRMA